MDGLSMAQVAQFYGFELNRAGYISCPFHGEKTASCKVYPEPGRGFYCFGCHAGGDEATFVMRLFGLTYPQAKYRLQSDFRLGSPSCPAVRRKPQVDVAFRAEYEEKTRLYRQYWKHFTTLAPAAPDAPWNPLWCSAAKELPYLDYWFERNPWR